MDGIWPRFSFHVCRRELLIISAMGIGMGLLALLPPYLTGVVLDEIVPSARHSDLLNVVLFLFVSMFTTALFTLVRSFGTLRMQTKLDSSLQAAVLGPAAQLAGAVLPAFYSRRSGTAQHGHQRHSSGADGISALLSILRRLFRRQPGIALLLRLASGLRRTGPHFRSIPVFPRLRICASKAGTPGSALKRYDLRHGALQFISGISKLRVFATERRAFAVWAKAVWPATAHRDEGSSRGQLGGRFSIPFTRSSAFSP